MFEQSDYLGKIIVYRDAFFEDGPAAGFQVGIPVKGKAHRMDRKAVFLVGLSQFAKTGIQIVRAMLRQKPAAEADAVCGCKKMAQGAVEERRDRAWAMEYFLSFLRESCCLLIEDVDRPEELFGYFHRVTSAV